jgi:hypothetical protein
MGKKGLFGFFNLYQFITPLVLGPLAYYIWFLRLGHRHDLTLLALSIPVFTAYFVPGMGTNYFKLWEFNTKFRMGRYRPHHGFVFGTGTALLAYLCMPAAQPGELSFYGLLQNGFIVGSTVAFWNLVYDIYAIRAGFVTVYNTPYAEGKGPEAIAMQYAPVYFGFVGAFFAIEVTLIEKLLLERHLDGFYWTFFIVFNLLTMTVPASIYMLQHFLRYGNFGVRPDPRCGKTSTRSSS